MVFSAPLRLCANHSAMPFPVTALEKRILAILALLIVLGLIGMAVL
jgi:hypothetical protein